MTINMTTPNLSATVISNTYSNTYSDSYLNHRPVLDVSFTEIDWQAPWLCHLRPLNYISNAIEALSSLSQQTDIIARDCNHFNADSSDSFSLEITDPDIIAKLLNSAMSPQNNGSQIQPPQTKPIFANQAHPLTFVSQDALPEGEGYESFIATTGNIPTRDNLHDLFNGSIWLTFPKTKALLNYHHMIEIDRQGNSDNRGRVRDTITVFDENGAILVTSDPSIGEALIDFDWQASLVTPRDSWDNPQQMNKNAQVAVYIFGHALIEQLIQPRKPLCAHSIVINVAQDFFALSLSERISYLDNKVAEHMDELLSQDNVTPRQLAPLPILGVPHFWAENTNAKFYDDNYVFRSGRRQNQKVKNH